MYAVYNVTIVQWAGQWANWTNPQNKTKPRDSFS